MKKQYKIATIASALCLSLIGLGVGAFAYLSDNADSTNKATTGTIDIDLKEDFPNEGGEFGEDTTSKTFWGVATGTKKSLARASIFVSIEYLNEETGEWEVLGSIPSNAVTYTVSDDTKLTWKEGTDGYWYYQSVLEGNPDGESPDAYTPNGYTTTQFEITDVKISGDDYLEIIKDYTVRINMLVGMETCQATNQAYKLSWENCDTDALPAGVK